MKKDPLILKRRIQKRIFIQSIIILLPLLCILFFIQQSYRNIQAEKNIVILKNDESNYLTLASKLIEYQFSVISEDLSYLTQLDSFLKILKDTSEYSNGSVMLLNMQGHWLYETEALNEWSFMFPERRDKSFAALCPEAWAEISGAAKGTFINRDGMYTFTRITPVLERKDFNGEESLHLVNETLNGSPYSWILITFISDRYIKKELTASLLRLYYSLGGIGLIFIAASFIIARSRVMKREADEELREAAAIFNKNPAPVIKTDLYGGILRYNETSGIVLHIKPGTTNIESLFPDFNEEKRTEILARGSRQFEETIEGRTYLFTIIPEENEKEFLIYGFDITSRKKAEEELERLHAAVEQSANTIVITDTYARIVFVNKAFEKSTGYTFEEAAGKNPRILKSGYHSKELYEELWRRISGGDIWHGQFLNRRKDGTTYWEEAVITPIKNSAGVIINYLAVKEDVTFRKQAEAELKRAKDEAESASRLKSEFLANMSHEIRTPMNAILGFTDILLDSETDREKMVNLEVIKASGKNLLNLINDILDFSKIEAGKIEINAGDFSFRKLINRIDAMFQPQAKEKGLSFKTTIHPEFPKIVTGDEYRINQIILNIVSNAFKFTEAGGVSMDCSYQNGTALLLVRDTGIGIPEVKRTTIFDAFEQGDTSTERKYGGTGLGLAISSRLAQLMEGTITFDSKPGTGTTFVLTIPLPEGLNAGEIGVPNSGAAPEEGLGFNGTGVETGYSFLDGEAMVASWINGMNGERDLETILFEYIQSLPEKIEKLTDAVIRDNIGDIKFIAHEMKGTSGNLGMKEIFDLTFTMDKAVTGGAYDREEAAESLKLLKATVQAIPKRYFAAQSRHVFPGEHAGDFKILLAEDNKINQKLVQKLLAQINLSCDAADNGAIALEKLEQERYDILLLDMQMPVLNGEETIVKIRANPDLNDLYVVALTAHAMKGDAERYLNLGCDDYLPKPIEKKNLFEKVQNRLVKKIKFPLKNSPETGKNIKEAYLGEEEKTVLRAVITGLKENISIFNPAKLRTLANKLKKSGPASIFKTIADRIESAAENFNDKSLPAIIENLEKAIGRE